MFYIGLLVLCFTVVSVTEALAQTPPPSSTAVPLDGFTGLLIAAGVGFGYRALQSKSSED